MQSSGKGTGTRRTKGMRLIHGGHRIPLPLLYPPPTHRPCPTSTVDQEIKIKIKSKSKSKSPTFKHCQHSQRRLDIGHRTLDIGHCWTTIYSTDLIRHKIQTPRILSTSSGFAARITHHYLTIIQRRQGPSVDPPGYPGTLNVVIALSVDRLGHPAPSAHPIFHPPPSLYRPALTLIVAWT